MGESTFCLLHYYTRKRKQSKIVVYCSNILYIYTLMYILSRHIYPESVEINLMKISNYVSIFYMLLWLIIAYAIFIRTHTHTHTKKVIFNYQNSMKRVFFIGRWHANESSETPQSTLIIFALYLQKLQSFGVICYSIIHVDINKVWMFRKRKNVARLGKYKIYI